MKKRILAIVCCAVMLLLAGCGSKTTEPEQGQENGENTKPWKTSSRRRS